VHRDWSGSIRDREGYYRSQSDAMRDVEAMIARTGGPGAWARYGPEYTGNVFS
jgi:hypothetical protein